MAKATSAKPSDTHSDTQLGTVPAVVNQDQRVANMLPAVLASYSALPDSEAAGCVTTLDLSLRDNQRQLQNILAGESKSLWDAPADKIIRVKDITAHFAEVPDEETGEVVGKRIITLTGPDGIYHTCSQYAYRDLQRSVLLTGWRPGDPPLKIRPSRARTRKGNTRQAIVLEE